MATVHPSYYEVKTGKQCLEDTKRECLRKLEDLEQEETKLINIICRCNEQLMDMTEEASQDGAVVSSGVS